MRLVNTGKMAMAGVIAAVFAASAVTLESETLALLFADAGQGFAVTGFVNKVEGRTWFSAASGAKSADFWELQFTGGPKGTATLQNHNPSRRSVRRLPCGGAAFRWEGLGLLGAPGAVDVEAKVAFAKDGSSEWTFAVANRATNGWALAYTSYPYLRCVLPAGECDALVPTKHLGARFIKGFKAAELSPLNYGYPGWYPMVTAFQRGAAGLYMAAHDREARIKTLLYEKDGSVRFETPMEDMGIAGKAAEGPRYPVVIAAYSGDWWSAARLYRNFAMTCPWTAKGPIAHRADFPKAMADIAFWCTLGGRVEDASNRIDLVRARWPDLKIGLHWYGWQCHSSFYTDSYYPEFLPLKGVMELLGSCRERNLYAMPYINGRLWDTQLMSFPYARRDACTRPDGTPQIENFGRGTAVMCPACPMWQDVLLRMGTNVVDGLGASVIYYDQVTCSRPMLCHSPEHSHPAGGGTWWTDGYRAAFRRIHNHLAPKNVPITSEGAGEFLLDLVDGHLICGRVAAQDDVPFLPAVYSGYTVYFGVVHCAPNYYSREVAVDATLATLWGCASGRWGYSRYFTPGPYTSQLTKTCAANADVIGALARARMAAADFLVYGHLEDELRPLDPPQKMKRRWSPPRKARPGRPAPEPVEIEVPSVAGAVWRDVDCTRRAVFAANVSEAAQTVRFRMPKGCGKAALLALPGQPAPDFSEADGVVTLALPPGAFAGVSAQVKGN